MFELQYFQEQAETRIIKEEIAENDKKLELEIEIFKSIQKNYSIFC